MFDYPNADLPALLKHQSQLAFEIEEAMAIAEAIEHGEMPRESKLADYTKLFFPDAPGKTIRELEAQSKSNWGQLHLRQVNYEISLLEMELLKPITRALYSIFSNGPGWSVYDQKNHDEDVAEVLQECERSIEAHGYEGFKTDGLTDRLNRIIKRDRTVPLAVIDSNVRFLAYAENDLRRNFQVFCENANAILKTCTNDMATVHVIYNRSNQRGRAGQKMRRYLQDEGSFCGEELGRAMHANDSARAAFNALTTHTKLCEEWYPALAQYVGVDPAEQPTLRIR